ncbi:MAG TPA: 4Fe-4S dicluster domain-containing protein [Steroidobacteraceae bacterium]|nr:4Fe-4S dicluster domain-containing protein [Steroidobacteraceae bacterium]
MNKREFLTEAVVFFPAAAMLQTLALKAEGKEVSAETKTAYDPSLHWYGMGIDTDKCIGCNRCVEACKAENNVPDEPYFFRTWIERYTVRRDGKTTVECISTRPGPAKQAEPEDPSVVRTFFVPKLCNQCANPPCVQVCPVGATFQTKDGVVLVDEKRCIGCRYCIQACPYGARYLNPYTRTADKCTFCYHRVTKGLQPACVEVCPTEARIFGDLNKLSDRLVRFQRTNEISVLKPDLNTEPKVRYAKLDGEVR